MVEAILLVVAAVSLMAATSLIGLGYGKLRERQRVMKLIAASVALRTQHDRIGIASPITSLNQHGEMATFFEALERIVLTRPKIK